MIASGGSVQDVRVDGTLYRIHAFTAIGSSTFTVTNPGNIGQVECLVVGGGGGGGGGYGAAGGGGAGGLVYHANKAFAAGSYNVVVGAGGVAGGGYTTSTADPNSAQHGRQGGNSILDNIVANGGGGGTMAFYSISNFRNGGSGGGAGDYYQSNSWIGGSRTQPFMSGGGMGYGFPGGSRGPGGEQGPITYESRNDDGGHASPHEGAGGGGAGGTSINGNSSRASDGGLGRNYPQFALYGSPLGWFAGGGGGGYHNNTANPRTNSQFTGGWWGGGGSGALENNNVNRAVGLKGNPGIANTGGGGGGGGNVNNVNIPNNGGGAGASGVVIIGYPLEEPKTIHKNLKVLLDPGNTLSYANDGLLKNIALTDASGFSIINPTNFVIQGGAPFSTLGEGSLLFDGGTTQRVSFPNFWGQVMPGNTPASVGNFNDDITVETWVRPTFLDASQRHVFTDGNFNEGELFFTNTGITAYWGGSATATWATTPALNTWYHVAVTHQKDWRANWFTVKLYVNGVLRATGNQLIQGSGVSYGPDGDLVFGYLWSGNIAASRIYTEVLEESQINKNYQVTRSRYGV
jgi:hypothetical protein